MELYKQLIEKHKKLVVVGLGYVGLPLAVAFSKKFNVIGFDTNEEKLEFYKKGIDVTEEIGSEQLKETSIEFTSKETRIKEASFIVIAVPTPVNIDKTPDLEPVISACELVGRNLSKGSIITFESTVYPGVTEEICIPILEKQSGLKAGEEFKVAYSPERINPGDKVHTLQTIIKIVSGMDQETLDTTADVYGEVIPAGTYKVSSIKVAEAAKLVENSQRDINIAFMNELAMVFDKIGIDTTEVIEAMNTKWNALRFYPGLVGGHCIGVDPYYFIYKAERLGYHSQIILSGRKINDSMGSFIADVTIRQLIKANKLVKEANVYIMGITFKENCSDIRNSKVMDIIEHLKRYEISVKVVDCVADAKDVKKEYKIELCPIEEVREADCLIFAVAHKKFIEMNYKKVDLMYKKGNKVLIDVKSIYKKEIFKEENGYFYWQL